MIVLLWHIENSPFLEACSRSARQDTPLILRESDLYYLLYETSTVGLILS